MDRCIPGQPTLPLDKGVAAPTIVWSQVSGPGIFEDALRLVPGSLLSRVGSLLVAAPNQTPSGPDLASNQDPNVTNSTEPKSVAT